MNLEYPITHYAPSFNHPDESIQINICDELINPYTKSRVLLGNLQNGLDVAVKFSGYKYGTKREWDGLRLVNTAGVSAPQLLCAVKDEASGRHGIISTRVNGKNLNTERSDLYRYKLGKVIAYAHDNVVIAGNEWQGSGKHDFTYFEEQMSSFRESHIAEINSTSMPYSMLRLLSKGVDTKFSSIVPVFTHNDVHNAQAIVGVDDEVSVIDFEEWKEEHPIKDLSIYLLHTLRNKEPFSDFTNFCLGFNRDRNLENDDLNFLGFYLLFAAIRSVDYHSKTLPSYVKTAIKTLDIITEALNTELIYK